MVCFCWLLIPSPLAICMSGMGSWQSSGGKVEDCVWLQSSVVLNKDLCSLLTIILAGYEPYVVHIKVYFTSSPLFGIFHEILARHLPPPFHCWAHLILPSGTQPQWKNYLKWQETCFLSTWLEDGFKGKKLLHNVWKFYARSFSHWWATTLWIIKTGFLNIYP